MNFIRLRIDFRCIYFQERRTLTMTPLEITNLIISILSLIGTVAISFVIYFLQTRNERKIREKETKENAKRFIIDNSDELDYLHWATIAVGCFPQNKHIRKIYNQFSYLDDETKKEVLKQRKINCELFHDSKWIYDKIEFIRNCIAELGIGDDFLYDCGKNFTGAYDYKAEDVTPFENQKYRNTKYKDEFKVRTVWLGKEGCLTYEQYLDDFLYCKYERKEDFTEKVTLPNDYLIEIENFQGTEEINVCYWMMVMVENVIIYAHKYLDYQEKEHIETDAQAETFEDKYFSVLYELFYLEKSKAPKEKMMRP